MEQIDDGEQHKNNIDDDDDDNDTSDMDKTANEADISGIEPIQQQHGDDFDTTNDDLFTSPQSSPTKSQSPKDKGLNVGKQFAVMEPVDFTSPERYVATSKYFQIGDVKKTKFRQISPKRLYDTIYPHYKKVAAHYLHVLNAHISPRKFGWDDTGTILVNNEPLENSNIYEALKAVSQTKSNTAIRDAEPGASLLFDFIDKDRQFALQTEKREKLKRSSLERRMLDPPLVPYNLKQKSTSSRAQSLIVDESMEGTGISKITRWFML
jgi:hypothetical protein